MDKPNPDNQQAIITNPLGVHPLAEIARLVENVEIKKVRMTSIQTLALGVLAGAFIALAEHCSPW